MSENANTDRTEWTALRLALARHLQQPMRSPRVRAEALAYVAKLAPIPTIPGETWRGLASLSVLSAPVLVAVVVNDGNARAAVWDAPEQTWHQAVHPEQRAAIFEAWGLDLTARMADK